MKMEQVSSNCFAVMNEKNRVCDSNSGLINLAGGMVIDTQSDLPHARQMMEMFAKVWASVPDRVVNTHEDSDHVFGNQLFEGAEIIGHSSLPERMAQVADPGEFEHLMHLASDPVSGPQMQSVHPGVVAVANQLGEDYNFSGVELVPPTTLFDDRLEIDLEGSTAHIIHVGPCHQVGDAIVWMPDEGVLFAGDILFRLCTPMGWVGTFDKWYETLDMIVDELKPEVIVPGHGPICGVEGATEMKAYLQYVESESRAYFDREITAGEAASSIDLGPYADWLCPERIYMNVERAYREFRGEAFDEPWDQLQTFDEIYAVAMSRSIAPNF
ncbi:MBL fold metallo-hydrolase [Gammaproteobacteria bacterium]|nr:MBL fold metallo-hydrolase [Gammaproteobacteria bacterium]